MTLLTVAFALLYYVAAAVLAAGLYWRVRSYVRTPAPFRIPTTPAPTTATGVALRLLREATLFESLFKASKWTWLFGWAFHFALLLVLLRHLRFVTEPVSPWVSWVQAPGRYATFGLLAGLAGLWARRLLVDRLRYISSPSDHLMLALLAAIAASGAAMTWFVPTDVVAVKAFFLGLMYFDWQPLPSDPLLLAHLALVGALMIVFPFSKLLHAPGLFFSPSRNQADDPRERRHQPAPWTVPVETPSRDSE